MDIHNDDVHHRFELSIDGLTAFMDYSLDGDCFLIEHTEVPSEFEGRGFGSALVRAGLEYARKNNLKVKSHCWFASHYMMRHPEFRDLFWKEE